MTIVLIPGTWDLLHYGHIKAMERASKFGDVLIVAVEDDAASLKSTVVPLNDRIAAIEAIRYVDVVVPYKYGNYLSMIINYSVDIFVLSEEHKGVQRFQEAVNYILEKGGKVIYLPYYKGISSTKIKKAIRNGKSTVNTA